MAEVGPLGGVTVDEIRKFAEEAVTPPTEAGSSLTCRFARGVAGLVVTRAAKGEYGQFSVFLRSEAMADDLATACQSIEFPLLANGNDSIANAVWLTSSSLASAFKLELVWTNSHTLFDAIRKLGFGRLPAVVVDWRQGKPLGTLYSHGLDRAEHSEQVIFEHEPITAQELKGVLDRFYERSLRTPALVTEAHAARVWQEAGKGIPEHRPEERIQGRLTDVLKAWCTRYEVRAEPVTQDGRADIVIYRRAYSQNMLPAVIHEWVLELKALCDMTSTGTSIGSGHVPDTLLKGLEQVIGYKFHLHALNSALCCYDMLKDDAGDDYLFSPLAKDASTQSVQLWRWFLFRATNASRQAKGYLTHASERE